jgi:hypothetical protein
MKFANTSLRLHLAVLIPILVSNFATGQSTATPAPYSPAIDIPGKEWLEFLKSEFNLDVTDDRNIKTVQTADLPVFADLQQLFDTAEQIDVPVYYIALYRSDTGACDLFVGYGNPDLAGVGVNTPILPCCALYPGQSG